MHCARWYINFFYPEIIIDALPDILPRNLLPSLCLLRPITGTMQIEQVTMPYCLYQPNLFGIPL